MADNLDRATPNACEDPAWREIERRLNAYDDMLAALKMVMQHGRIDDSEERLNIVAAAIAKAAP